MEIMMLEEVKKEDPRNIPDNKKSDESQADFKICEIRIKEGQLILDASPEFWMDKLRALGVLEMCKDIVKNFNKENKKSIIPASKHMLKDFASRLKFRRR